MSVAREELPGYVLLEDGTRLDGELCGQLGRITGEVVFNTAMTGYQESVTDPSYAGQIITFTYPLIGNYGVSAAAMESHRVHARGVIMREGKNAEDAAAAEGGWLDWLADCGVPAISGVDTRALVRHIRDRGAMRGGIFPAELAEADAREMVLAEPSMDGADLAREVTPSESIELAGEGPHVVAIDTGIKLSIIRQLRERGCRLTLLPCTASVDDVLARDPDLVFLANGPGDPAALDHVVENVRGLVGKKPVVGICLGHQLLCRAVGLETFKLPFGHRGANHPVKDLATGRIDITSQNHGFAVSGPGGEGTIEGDEPVRWSTDFGEAELSHLNLYDRTVEGLGIYAAQGFERFLLLTGYKGEQIADWVGAESWGGVEIDCVDTGVDTATGGRIKLAQDRLGGRAFNATYADGLADVDLRELLAFHQGHEGLATLTAVRPPLQFGVAEIDDDGRVREFSEKPQLDHWINGGFFRFESGVLDYLEPDSVLEREPFERLAASGELRAHRHSGFWDCMDTYKDAVELNDIWATGRAPWPAWAAAPDPA